MQVLVGGVPTTKLNAESATQPSTRDREVEAEQVAVAQDVVVGEPVQHGVVDRGADDLAERGWRRRTGGSRCSRTRRPRSRIMAWAIASISSRFDAHPDLGSRVRTSATKRPAGRICSISAGVRSSIMGCEIRPWRRRGVASGDPPTRPDGRRDDRGRGRHETRVCSWGTGAPRSRPTGVASWWPRRRSPASTPSSPPRPGAPTPSPRSPGGAGRPAGCVWAPRSCRCPGARRPRSRCTPDPGPPIGGRVVLGMGCQRPAGRRGLVRRALREAARPHPRGGRHRPAGPGPRGARDQPRPAPPAAVRRPRLDRPGQAAQAHHAPAARRRADLARRRGAAQRRADRRDRRWLDPAVLHAGLGADVPGVARRGLRADRARGAPARTSRSLRAATCRSSPTRAPSGRRWRP